MYFGQSKLELRNFQPRKIRQKYVTATQSQGPKQTLYCLITQSSVILSNLAQRNVFNYCRIFVFSTIVILSQSKWQDLNPKPIESPKSLYFSREIFIREKFLGKYSLQKRIVETKKTENKFWNYDICKFSFLYL